MNQKLTLADGTEYDCRLFGLASVGILYIDLVGTTLLQALTDFSSSEKTSKMVCVNENETIVREGFTKILGVEIPSTSGDIVRVSMRKPYVDEVDK